MGAAGVMAVEAYKPSKVPSDVPFLTAIWGMSGMYVLLILAVLLADASYTSITDLWAAVKDPDIRASIWLTLHTCTITAILSVFVSVPAGYVLARYKFPLKRLFDAILDIPIVLPPLVIGLSLLILFNQVMIGGQSIEKWESYFVATAGRRARSNETKRTEVKEATERRGAGHTTTKCAP